jgi:tetratricopeptide (TPR) repeat protein
MRTRFAILLLLLASCMTTAKAPKLAPDDLLQRGRDSYKAGRYAEAVPDLTAAADAFFSPAQRQASLDKFETAVVYLTVAYARLGKDAEAAEQIRRLAAAEAIAPTYAKLPLTADVADFEDVAKRVAPSVAIPANHSIASLRGAPPTPQRATIEQGLPDTLLQRGRDSFKTGHYADAVADLTAAADAFLSPAQVQTYVATGQLPSLDKFETAIVYLTLAYSKLGKDPDAAEQVRRLAASEAIAPTYAKLPFSADVADFEDVARRVAPSMPIPANASIAALRGGAPPPPIQVAQVPPPPQPPARPPTQVAQVPPPPPPAPAPQPATTEQVASARAESQREADQRVAAARAASEKEAQQRIAAERAAIQKTADEKIAAAQETARKEADRVIAEARAAAEREMQEKINAERAASQKTVADRIAAERAALERETQQRIAEDRAAAQKQLEANPFTILRRAEAQASSGQVDEANTMYLRLLSAPDASRDTVAAVAIGLYRTGDYRDALRALQKLGTFLRGEEDLRFYKAVALYETGRYAEAKKELACALPYIQVTDDVSRYRTKIEQTP